MCHLLLLLLILVVSGAHSGTYTLHYYCTGVSEPGHGLPIYFSAAYIGDIQIQKYDSDSGYTRPAMWLETVEGDPGYWKRQTQIGKGDAAWFKYNVKTLMRRFNHSGGFHSFQRMYGCELDDDGTTRGYDQFGYDGQEFISLDTDRNIWVPIMTEAQFIAQKCNSPEVLAAERHNNYLEGECIESIRKYIRSGSAELERKVPPQVKVSGHQSDAVTKIHCRVYGFYPKAVDVKWVKNGEIDLMSEEAAQVLPNPDGTYQLRVTVEVIPKDGDSFSCHVDHSSLKEPLVKNWETGKGSQTLLYIIIAAVGVVLLIAAAGAAGYFVYRPQVIHKQDTY